MNTVYTIGHSTRTTSEFIELLKDHCVSQLVDIRSIPGSRHNPQFGQEALSKSLEKAGLKYLYLKKLGGLRSAPKDPTIDALNDGWRNRSFRNYADYMQTQDFLAGIEQLMNIAEEQTTAIMCAEAVPWRCHRSLVADALIIRKIPVCEIISKSNTRKHSLTSFAIVEGTRVIYPMTAIKDS